MIVIEWTRRSHTLLAVTERTLPTDLYAHLARAAILDATV
jgi:hypothetical protein